MANDTETDVQDSVQAKSHDLVVIHPFGKYRRGDSITDDAEIADVLASETAHHVRRVFVA
jgi:hypothetical protein